MSTPSGRVSIPSRRVGAGPGAGRATSLDGVIVGIDSSIGTAVAVIDPNGLVRARGDSRDPHGHAEAIGTLLADALTAAAAAPALGEVAAAGAVSADPITHVAVGMGPGPFTGLRVGIAAARAFALARDIPVLPVVSHDAVALAVQLAAAIAGDDPGRFAVVTDARRRERAFTVYDGEDAAGLPIRATEPALVADADLDARLAALGAARCDATGVDAAMVALVASRALAAGRASGPATPLYLRAPDVAAPAPSRRVGA